MKEEGIQVPMTKLCAWFEVPRRTMYYRTVKSAPKVQERFEKPIKEMIEQDPSFGYRTVAALLNCITRAPAPSTKTCWMPPTFVRTNKSTSGTSITANASSPTLSKASVAQA